MDKIFIVFRNADFTEGRGPMLFHSAFSDGEEAIRYVEEQGGIYGSPQRVERGKYGYFAHANGYHIKEVALHGSAEDIKKSQEEAARKTALAKLTARERKLLDLEGKF